MSRPELPPGWRWMSDQYAMHVGTRLGVVFQSDAWFSASGDRHDTLADAIASHADRVSEWEVEVRRVVAATAAPARDPRVDPRPGDVLRVVTDDGSVEVWRVYRVNKTTMWVDRCHRDGVSTVRHELARWADWSNYVSVDVLWPR